MSVVRKWFKIYLKFQRVKSTSPLQELLDQEVDQKKRRIRPWNASNRDRKQLNKQENIKKFRGKLQWTGDLDDMRTNS